MVAAGTAMRLQAFSARPSTRPNTPLPRSIIKREVEERLGSHGEFGRVSFARLSFGRWGCFSGGARLALLPGVLSMGMPRRQGREAGRRATGWCMQLLAWCMLRCSITRRAAHHVLRCSAPHRSLRRRQPPLVTAVKGVPIRDEDQLAMGERTVSLLSCCCLQPKNSTRTTSHCATRDQLSNNTQLQALFPSVVCAVIDMEVRWGSFTLNPSRSFPFPFLHFCAVIDMEVRWAGEPDVVMQLSGIPGAAVAVRTCQARGPSSPAGWLVWGQRACTALAGGRVGGGAVEGPLPGRVGD